MRTRRCWTFPSFLGLCAGVTLGAQTLPPLGNALAEYSWNTFSMQGAGARAMGLGGAFIAIADDASAITFNPAGIAEMVDPEFSMVGRAYSRQLSFQGSDAARGIGGMKDTFNSETRVEPIFLSGTLPLRAGGRNLTFQFSAHRLFALKESTERQAAAVGIGPKEGSTFDMANTVRQDGHIDRYALAVAYDLSPRMLMGIAYHSWHGGYTSTLLYDSLERQSETDPAPQKIHGTANQLNHLEGEHMSLGLLWRSPMLRIGMFYDTPFRAQHRYAWHFRIVDTAEHELGHAATLSLHWPESYGLGVAFRPLERLLVTLDARHTPWSKLRYFSNDPVINGLDFFSLQNPGLTADATNLHAGVEFLVFPLKGAVVPLRFGLSREVIPLRDRATHQLRVLHGASVGTGIKIGRMGLDLAYRFSYSQRNTSFTPLSDGIMPDAWIAVPGEERTQIHRVDASLIFQFDRRPVETFLRRVFVGD